MKNIILFLLIFIFVQKFLFAENTIDSKLKGVWQGTIGKQGVVVCMNEIGMQSEYYYLRYRIPISLKRDGIGFVEGGKELNTSVDFTVARWTFDNISPNQIIGYWIDSQTKRKLPISLSPVLQEKQDDDEVERRIQGNCILWSSYINSLLDKERQDIKNEKFQREIKKYNGKTYQEIAFSELVGRELSTIQLMEKGPVGVELNRKLYNSFKEQLATLYECPKDSHYEDLFEHRYSVTINFWDSDWITLLDGGYTYCNGRGAHPWGTGGINTYDLHTGKSVDLWAWFQGKRLTYEEENHEKRELYYWLPEGLRQLILKKNELHSNETGYPKETYVKYDLMLGEQAITFACSVDERWPLVNTDIAYTDLLPFLTNEGKAAVKSIMAENEKK